VAASESKTVILAALIGNTLIAITKFAAAAATGSSAMLSEGIHSVVDTGNQVLLLVGLHRARMPADEQYPFGRGKEVYFWSFVVAILIFAVGAGISIYEGVIHILDPHPVENHLINYIVLGAAMVFEGVAWVIAYRSFNRIRGDMGRLEAIRRGKDPSMFVVLFEDTAAMMGLAIAFVGVFLGQLTGNAVFDGLASILIGCVLAATAAWLAAETKSLLIGERAHPRVIQGIRERVGSHPAVTRVDEVLTLHMGPDFILVNVSVNFDPGAAARVIEEAVADIDRRIRKAYPEVKRVFIEAESGTARSATF
jgi:cation diffusion facilitator family transporter